MSMLEGIVEGLIIAFILSLFGIDAIFIEVLQPFVPDIILTGAHYYFAFGFIGFLGGALIGN